MNDDLLEYYGRRAPEYEGIYRRPERVADLAALVESVEQLARGHRVIEIACGTGYWTRVMARSADFILATDASPDVLAVAQAHGFPADNVTLGLADAFRLKSVTRFPESHAPEPLSDFVPFDLLFAGFWWSHVRREDLASFLQAATHTLRPGARLAFIDNNYVPGNSTPVSRLDAGGNSFQLRRLDDGGEYEVLKNFPADAELEAAIEPFATDVRIARSRFFWLLSGTTPGSSL